LTGKSGSDIETSRAGKKSDNKENIFLGFPKQRWLLIFGDLLFITLAHFIASWIRFGQPINIISLYTQTFTITIVIYPVALYVFDLYNISRLFRSWETAYRSALAIILGGTLSIFIFYLIPHGPYGRGIMAVQMGVTWIFLNGLRWFYGVMFQSTMTKIPALILGAGFTGRAVYELLKSSFAPYEIRGFVDDDPAKQGLSMSPAVLGTCDQLETIAGEIGATTAIMAIPRNRPARLIRSILNARLHGMDVRDTPDVFEQLTGRIPVEHIADQWLLFAEGFSILHKEYVQKLKRLIDLVVSAFVLVLTGPLVGLVTLAIRLESPGPVLYGQERVGKGQRTFTIYKFRSMRHNAEVSGAKWATEKDPRVTRVGRWLRLTHIDELPQIWNIFKGDMSFVGPRPERPEFVRILEKEIPYYFVRHSVSPGLTGWAQINYQYGASVEDALRKLEFDLYYVKNMSIFLDLKIILRTMGVVILRDGAR
jgi:sugar transferase (PEP-CTERM system associated)